MSSYADILFYYSQFRREVCRAYCYEVRIDDVAAIFKSEGVVLKTSTSGLSATVRAADLIP